MQRKDPQCCAQIAIHHKQKSAAIGWSCRKRNLAGRCTKRALHRASRWWGWVQSTLRAPDSIREVDRGHQQEQCEAQRMGNNTRSLVHYTTEEVGQDNHLQHTKHCCEEGEGNNLLSTPQRTGAEWWAVVMERQVWAGHQTTVSADGMCKHGARLPANNAKPLLLAAPQHRSYRHW